MLLFLLLYFLQPAGEEIIEDEGRGKGSGWNLELLLFDIVVDNYKPIIMELFSRF